MNGFVFKVALSNQGLGQQIICCLIHFGWILAASTMSEFFVVYLKWWIVSSLNRIIGVFLILAFENRQDGFPLYEHKLQHM